MLATHEIPRLTIARTGGKRWRLVSTLLPDYLLQRTKLLIKLVPSSCPFFPTKKTNTLMDYLNYLYVLKQGNKKYIAKHSKKTISSGISLAPIDPKRNYLEYMTYQLRAGLAPQMVPETYYADPAAHYLLWRIFLT